jgi:hypothetical protein
MKVKKVSFLNLIQNRRYIFSHKLNDELVILAGTLKMKTTDFDGNIRLLIEKINLIGNYSTAIKLFYSEGELSSPFFIKAYEIEFDLPISRYISEFL